ncbi:Hypothetical predicted protein [Lecanosticta acicola]|uniref:Vps72/YL1 C-terminal domain-containing protein n=1 Tax=Lecanosticta acicola TaxID=111012 RepID=A0AAI9EAL7_9PEZI|nr:Hypothetical predicted protein [Lecanosticta acicola]
MSDDDSSSSDGEAVDTTGLIATRAKRSTAGNLYATLRANLDDEELQKELLAEDEEDAGDYEGSDREDDDEAMESSSDDEDAGPPKEGDKEDLEGEKELKKTERAEARKKRKMDEVKMRLPAWQKKKKVKLADDVKTEDGAPARPKKKSERSNWLPTAADMPVRQSSRASAIANREVVHTNLKESAIRSEKQKRVMANHAERQQAKKRAELTQEERLAKATRIEKETAREFGRWEREEAERQRIREEQLAAKRKRGIDGPIIRNWSGSVLWEGDKIKIKRLHGSQNLDTIGYETKEAENANGDVPPDKTGSKPTDETNLSIPGPATPTSNSTAQLQATGQPLAPPALALQAPPASTEMPAQVSWLEGIQEYAAQQPDSAPPALSLTTSKPIDQAINYTPSAPAINALVQPPSAQYPTMPLKLPSAPSNPSQLHPPPIYHGLPPTGYHEWNLQHPQTPRPPLPPAPPAPLIKEQARQSLVILEQFENLENATAGKRGGASKKTQDMSTEPTPIASTLMSESYPSFTPDEVRYLTGKFKKSGMPLAPTRAVCALTCWKAKYRDPKTGLPYFDMQQYKMIQRLLAGGCQYSRILGAFVGPDYGPLGRPAKGVPEGFGAPATALVPAKSRDDDVKTEEA